VARLAGLPETVLSRARQVLGVLESRSSGHPAPMLDDLPLFAAAPPQRKAEVNPLNAMLDLVRPDELSPREALELIYELKKARDAGRRS
jgi:DNA mismatch repair protein MutS